MKPASIKAKGRNLQNKIRDFILKKYPDLDPSDVVSCPMGSSGVDIQLSAAARDRFNFSVECKASARSTIQTYYEQAKRLCYRGSTPIVATKADRKEILITMSLADFERLVLR